MNRAISLLTIKSVNEEERVIDGIASTPTTDRMGDIIEPKGAQFKLPLPLLWQHRAGEPIGQVIAAKVTDKGIEVRAKIEKDLLPRIDEAWALIKSGLVRGLSIGFNPLEHAQIDGTFGIRFNKWEWLELSAVTIAANQDASIQTIKSIDAKDLRAALGREQVNRASGSTPPGAAGQRPERTTMKTPEQQLAELQEQRAAHAERIKEINEGCNGDFTSLNKEDAAEFRELSRELERDDEAIANAKTVQRAIGSAVEVPASAGLSQEHGSRSRQGLPAEPKKKETDPARKGIAFAQFVRLMYHAKGMPVIAQQIADRQRSKLDPRVPILVKAAVEAGSVSGTSTAGNWGMQLVGDETGAVADFLEFLRPMTILGKFGANGVPNLRRVPFRVPLVGMTDGGTGYWVGEGKPKPLTKFGFSRNTLEPLKVAAITVVTKELLADSSPAADGMLRDALAAALNERTDVDFIDPAKAAVSGVSPASITNGLTPIGATGTGDAADIRTDVRAAFGAFIAANNPPTSGVWIMSATTALGLSLMQNALGQAEFPGIDMNGGRFAGLPVIVSEHVPTTTNGHLVALVNAQDIYYGDDGGVQVDTSEHASLQMDDAPTNDSVTPTATSVVSMYQTNSVAFRAERRIDWLRRRDSGVQIIEQVNWGEA